MMPNTTIELITDAVIDVVKEQLPGLIREAATLNAHAHAQTLANALAEIRDKLTDLQAQIGAVNTRTDAACAAVLAELHDELPAMRATLTALVKDCIAQLPPAPQGERGPPGADGRDASFTEPVPWSERRTYARGAVVQHRNALWYANVATDREPGSPMSGYTLIVDGALPAAIEPDESGALWLRFEFASGASARWPLHFRPLEYAGIWDATRAYHTNDCVTCEGSMWIARRPVSEQRPGTDAGAAAWTLAVKRGKDGRDGKDGINGRDGKDAPARTRVPSPEAHA